MAVSNTNENTGTAIAPDFAAVQVNPFSLTAIDLKSEPTFVDLDGDGDLDMMSGEYHSSFYYFENIGTALAPAFAAVQINPFSLSDVNVYYSAPAFADLDGDGDMDMISGDYYGNFYYFENIGTALAPDFAAAQVNPFSLSNIGQATPPSFADIDGDGDMDLMAGELYGSFYYFENTGTANAPVFATAQVNPFSLSNIGYFSSPAFADLDGDGDLDLMSGNFNGNFYYFQFAPPLPPSITTEPTDNTICSGNNTSFGIVATDATGYQWQEDAGSGFSDLSNGVVYSNVTTETLNITGATSAMNNYKYRCVVTGATTPNDISAVATLTVNTTPTADAPANVTACDSYTLPALTVGDYFTGTNGTGTALSATDVITSTQTIYVYAETGTTPNCTDENSFTVTINTSPTADSPANVTACDSYILPALTVGDYFTGTNGTGTALSATDVITSTQTIYVYAETGTTPNCTDENSFTVTINTTPNADAPANVTACDSYTLPALTVGDYFTGTNGTGTALFANDVITSTQTIYVYAETGTTPNCTDENSFTVTINTTPTADAPANVTACDSYTLPALTVGNYFTETGGTGTALFAD
jgi:uncharacterized protein YuzB (UPF0349 family)